MKPVLVLLAAAAWAPACSGEEVGGACVGDVDCLAGTLCAAESGTCLQAADRVPSLEVRPPNGNNKGWVAQEFLNPGMDSDGHLRIKLEQAISISGNVYSTDAPDTPVQAQVIAWRDSLVAGRPRVQVETTTVKATAKSSTGASINVQSYVLWLNRGHTYTFLVSPKSPYSVDYPPLVVPNLKLDGHTRRDFVLDGKERTLVVEGRILDATGNPLKPQTLTVEENKKTGVRVRAYETNGLNLSTIATTQLPYLEPAQDPKPLVVKDPNPDAGKFTFRVTPGLTVPFGGRVYTIQVENEPGSVLIPTVTCSDIILGIYSGSKPLQLLGDLRLPSFQLPQTYTWTVKGKDDKPVVGAMAKFSMSFAKVPASDGFSNCTAIFERTAVSDSEGKISLQLLPGTTVKNQLYAVTLTSPSSSKWASRHLPEMEVGPTGGQNADIVLEPRSRISGRVVQEESGAPVVGASVEAQGLTVSGQTVALPPSKSSTLTDSQGSYSLYVEAGSYNFSIRPPSGLSLAPQNIDSKLVSGDLAGVVFRLARGKLLSGWVLDPDAVSMENASVEVYDLVQDSPKTKKADLQASDVTASDGAFQLVLK